MSYVLSARVNQDSQFLKELDANLYSVALQGDVLQRVEKRSSFQNFVSWFIYLITFTLVPRNADLDCVSLRILGKISDELNNPITRDDQKLLKKAVKTLIKIVHSNCGSLSQEANRVHAAIKAIQTVPAVQQLQDAEEIADDHIDIRVPVAPLASFLQNLIDRTVSITYVNELEIRRRVIPLLGDMQEPVVLSEEQSKIFGEEILHICDDWLEDKSRQLNEKMISFFTRISIIHCQWGCIEILSRALKKEPIDKSKLKAFTTTICEHSERLTINDIWELLCIFSDSREGRSFMFTIKTHLLEADVQKFVQTLLEKGISQITEIDSDSNRFYIYARTLDREDRLGAKYQSRIQQILSPLKPIGFIF